MDILQSSRQQANLPAGAPAPESFGAPGDGQMAAIGSQVKSGLPPAPPPSALPQPTGMIARDAAAVGQPANPAGSLILYLFIVKIINSCFFSAAAAAAAAKSSIAAVSYNLLQPGTSIVPHNYTGDDPTGLPETAEYILREWVLLFHNPSFARDSSTAYARIVTQVELQEDLVLSKARLDT